MKAELESRILWPEEGARVLCAVSGGADSMCLLSVLRESGRFSVAAAHFEHGLRGEESLRDCAFVESYCRERGIPCFTEHADVGARARETGRGVEETARELRYAFLEAVADREGYDWIATGHNADDNAETVLFHLARGTGLRGLGGIPPHRGRILRPLLGLTRREILQLLEERGVPHVEDSSNDAERYARNRIRHRVTPTLREINPAFALAVGRTAAQLRRDADCLDAMAERFLREQFDGESFSADALLALHEAVSCRVIRRLLPPRAEERHAALALDFCRGSERAFLDLPGGRWRRERRKIYPADDGTAPEIPETVLPEGVWVPLAPAGLEARWDRCPEGQEIHNSFKTYWLKCESINKTLSVSSPRPGERYRPAGRGCTKTLKALFAEKRCTRREKLLTPVFRDETGIVLVPPFGAAERCAPKEGERLAAVSVRKIDSETRK